MVDGEEVRNGVEMDSRDIDRFKRHVVWGGTSVETSGAERSGNMLGVVVVRDSDGDGWVLAESKNSSGCHWDSHSDH